MFVDTKVNKFKIKLNSLAHMNSLFISYFYYVRIKLNTLYISTNNLLDQSVVCTYQKVVKLTQFNFSLLIILFLY